MDIAYGGEAAVLSERQTTVVYTRDTGEIRHVHHTLIMEGAAVPSEDEIMRAAIAQADEAGLDMTSADVLHIGRHEFDPQREYSVDPAARSLVEGPRGKRSEQDERRGS